MAVTLSEREKRNGHKAAVLWLTGLPGAGKTTIAERLECKLFGARHQVAVLDGDNLRDGLSSDLGFSIADRSENIRRVGHVAKLFYEYGNIVVCAFICPRATDRAKVRTLFPRGRFYEVHLDCPVEECMRRDPKGLYRRAIAGLIPDFTGVSSQYEIPRRPDLRLDTKREDVDACVELLMRKLVAAEVLRRSVRY